MGAAIAVDPLANFPSGGFFMKQSRNLIAAAFVAAGLMAGSTNALANNVVNLGLSFTGDTAFFGALHFDSDPFTDTFEYAIAGDWLASASIVTIGFTPEQNIDFVSATLNGNVLTLSPTGPNEFGFTLAPLAVTGPLTLIVSGTTGAKDGKFSTYSGTLNITPVPEAETWAMLLAGLGLVGMKLSRRQNRETMV
jgi:hypothetical protein